MRFLSGIFKALLHVIEKVAEGRIGNYRYVAFYVTPDEIGKHVKEARKEVAEVLEDVMYGQGIPEPEIKKHVDLVKKGAESVYNAIEEAGVAWDWYFPLPEEVAASYVLSGALSNIPRAPADATAFPEPGYGLPEYSLYTGPDARSFKGRWYWSKTWPGRFNVEEICFGLRADVNTCYKIVEKIRKLKKEAEKQGKQLLFAVWEEKS